MRVLDLAQGSDEWFRARLGIPTASQMHRILTPAHLKPSKQADEYARELLAEYFIGETVVRHGSGFMTRGTDFEPYGRRYYGYVHNVVPEQAGFVLRDDGLAGCSPDSLIGDDGILEVKVPSAKVHIEYLLNRGKSLRGSYFMQLVGNLLICERDWIDVMSWHPSLPDVTLRLQRGDPDVDKALASLSAALDTFVHHMLLSREALERAGCERAMELALDPAEAVAQCDPSYANTDEPF